MNDPSQNSLYYRHTHATHIHTKKLSKVSQYIYTLILINCMHEEVLTFLPVAYFDLQQNKSHVSRE